MRRIVLHAIPAPYVNYFAVNLKQSPPKGHDIMGSIDGQNKP